MRVLRSAASAVVSLALLIGVPWLLTTTIGNPLRWWPDLLAGDVSNQVVLAALAAVLWLAWAQFAVAFAVELVSAARRTPMPARIPGVFAVQQGLARALINGALLLLPVTVSSLSPACQALAMTAADHPTAAAVSLTHAAPAPATTSAARQAAAAPAEVATRAVTVTGDGPRTWWDLAGAHLGDGAAWRQLWALNHGRQQADGTVMSSDRTVLRTGWTVLIPATATTTIEATTVAAAGAAADAVGREAGEVTVRAGDTLSQIAADRGIADWTQLWPVNAGRPEPGGRAFTDPDYIEPGWRITVPAAAANSADTAADSAADMVVTVAPGDTLSQIAADHGADIDAVIAANQGKAQPGGGALTDPDEIAPGWHLVIPGPADIPVAPPGGAADSTPGAVAGPAPVAPPVIPATPVEPVEPPPGPGGDGAVPVVPSVDWPAADAPPTPSAAVPSMSVDWPAADAPPTPSAAVPSMSVDWPAVAPEPPAPPPAPAAQTGDTQAGDTPAGREQGDSSRAAFAVFGGGGGVLAAVALAALVRYRRRQFRHRRPGQRIASTPDELVGMERALLTAGGAAAADATWLDEAIRGLAQQLAGDPRARLPEVVAACLTDTRLELVLDAPRTDPPGAWTAAAGGGRWILRRTDPTGYDPRRRGYLPAPFPALATVGHTPGGQHWLLDLERIGSLTIAGNPDRAAALARFMAAELAHNSWSEMLTVTLVGFGVEMADMYPDRLAHVPDAATALAAVAQQRRSVAAVIDEAGVDVLHGRLHDVAGDAWAPHVLLIAPTAGDATAVTELAAAVTADAARSTVALVMTSTDDTAAAGNWQVRITDDGVLSIPDLRVDVVAQQIPAEQAAQLAQLLAYAADTSRPRRAANPPRHARNHTTTDTMATTTTETGNDVGIDAGIGSAVDPPIDSAAAAGDTDTDTDTDTDDGPDTDAGSREPGPDERPGSVRAGSVLPLPEQTYLARAATTTADLAALAPAVPARVRERVEAADRGLDGDLADWRDGSGPRPKVGLLGAVTVHPGGPGPAVSSSRSIEIVAYLAAHPSGVGIERYACDLWPDEPDIIEQTTVKSKVRTSISQVRRLLGVNPRTGADYLPRNAGTLGAQYRLDGDVLIDADLFRRLRVRGLARGAAGVGDLWAALDLVRGVPLDGRRPGGYGWLAGLPLDHEYTAMIVDLAHTVATHHLGVAEPERATAAAQVALRAGSSEDTPLLDLVAACQAQGRHAQAESWVKKILVNHDVQDEEDLPPRTYEILRRRKWLPPAA